MEFSHGIHPAVAGPRAVGCTNDRLHDFESLARQWGWPVNIGYLDQTRGPVRVEIEKSAVATVVEVTTSCRLEVLGRTHEDMIAVLMPADSTRVLLNNYKVSPGEALVLPTDEEVAAWCCNCARMLLAFIPVETLYYSGLFEPHDRRWLLSGRTLFALRESGLARRLRGMVEQVREQSDTSHPAVFEARDSVVCDDRDGRSDEACTVNCRYNRIIRQSVNYVESHLSSTISIADLSRATATSVSKLERTFRNELGMTPSRYIAARRLVRARRFLGLAESASTTVASVAYDAGFRHLGRFSGAYRRQFGELPRETLRFGLQAH